MFTGIVETIGIIKHIFIQDDCVDLLIEPQLAFSDLTLGESIAVNGVCLTVTDFSKEAFHVTAVPQTLRVTNLGLLQIGHRVNLERSLTLNSRVGGHLVQGHVDTLGEIIDIQSDGDAALIVKINIPKGFAKYIVNKGYITLDGMSITVIQANDHDFTVTFIPHTQNVTIIRQYQVGTKINIEVDMLGKYIEKLMGANTICNPI